jgi:hypothetical protein
MGSRRTSRGKPGSSPDTTYGLVERGGPVARDEADARRDAERLGVVGRDGERGGRDVDRDDLGVRQLRRERHGERAAPGAEVEDADRPVARRRHQRALDDELRLRPRHEHVRRHAEGPRPELASPREVRHGLTLAATLDQRAIRVHLGAAERPVEAQVHADPVGREHLREQQLRVEARALDAASREELRRQLQIRERGLRRRLLHLSRHQCAVFNASA